MAIDPGGTMVVPALLAAPDSPGRYGPTRGGGDVPGRGGGSNESDPAMPAQGGGDLAALRVQVAVLARDVKHAGALADTVAAVAGDAIRSAHEAYEGRAERDWTRFDAAQEKTAGALEKLAEKVAALDRVRSADSARWSMIAAVMGVVSSLVVGFVLHLLR